MEELANMDSDPSIKQAHDDASVSFFQEADADGDGRHNFEEMKKYFELEKEWNIKRYGGDGDEQPDELKEGWYNAMNGMSEGDGYSYEDKQRADLILITIIGELQAGAGTGGQ